MEGEEASEAHEPEASPPRQGSASGAGVKDAQAQDSIERNLERPTLPGPNLATEAPPTEERKIVEVPIKTEVKMEDIASELSGAEPMDQAGMVRSEADISDSTERRGDAKEVKKPQEEAERESECRLCSLLDFPIQARLFTDARRRRGHVCAHWEVESGGEAGSGARLLERHSGATGTAWFRRLLFRAFPAAETLANIPPSGRKTHLLGTLQVPSDLTARGWDWDGRAAMPPPKDRPRAFPSRQLRRQDVADPSLFHFCTDCGRALRKASKDGSGGRPLEHVLTVHQVQLFVRCPVEGCGFGDRFQPRKVRQHIASVHPDRTGLEPLDERARRWPEIRPLATRLFPEFFESGTKMPLCPSSSQASRVVTYPERQLRREDVTDPSLYNFCAGCDRVVRKSGGKTLQHILTAHQTKLFVLCPVEGCGFGDRGRAQTVRQHIVQAHPDKAAMEPIDERTSRWKEEILPLAAELFPGVYGTGKRTAGPQEGGKELITRDNCGKPKLYHFCSLCGRGFRRGGGSDGAVHALRHQERLFVRCPVEGCGFGDQGSLAAVRRHISEAHSELGQLAPLDERRSHGAEVSAQILRCFPSRQQKSFSLRARAGEKEGLAAECALCQAKVRIFAAHGKVYAVRHATRHHMDFPAVRCLACNRGFSDLCLFRLHDMSVHDGETGFEDRRADIKRFGFALARLCFPRFDELRWTTKPSVRKTRTLLASAKRATGQRSSLPPRKAEPVDGQRRCLRCRLLVGEARLAGHALRHFPRGGKAFRCSACAYQTNLRPLAARHARFAHRGEGATVESNVEASGKALQLCFPAKLSQEESEQPARPEVTKQGFQCTQCDAVLGKQGPGRLYHALRHLGLKPLSCSSCQSFSADCAVDVEKHIETEHGETPGVKMVSSFELHKERIAEFRQKLFDETKMVARPVKQSVKKTAKRGNSRRARWQCLKCDGVMKTSSRLVHALKHLKLDRYACPVCPGQFTSSNEASSHIAMEHAGVSDATPPEPVANYRRGKDVIGELFRKASKA